MKRNESNATLVFTLTLGGIGALLFVFLLLSGCDLMPAFAESKVRDISIPVCFSEVGVTYPCIGNCQIKKDGRLVSVLALLFRDAKGDLQCKEIAYVKGVETK
jgi:hypothetical protein